MTLERALALAATAHAGQLDKAGQPYILHPLRVLLRLAGPEARIVAALHDVVEDTPVTLDDLRREGFSRAVVEAVDALTHREGESYEAYVRRAAANSLARQVKRADVLDNLDATRLVNPTPADLRRLEKYRGALALLDEIDAG
jgi:(p)ppGpp synthase/HD superfamily hydrolase